MLIKSKDDTPIENLNRSSKKHVWVVCDECECGYLKSYYNYLNSDEDICWRCKNIKAQNDPKVKEKIRKKQKDSWKGKRYKPQKEKYYNTIYEEAKSEGFIILTGMEEYKFGNEKLQLQCKNGHIIEVTYKEWKKGRRCYKCKEDKKEDRIKKICKNKNFELIDYGKDKIRFKCENGHFNEITLSNFYKEQNCGKCDLNASDLEYEVRNILDLYNIDYVPNSKDIIPPYEIDLYLPKYKLAIEVNGFPSHTENIGGKDRKYHLMKTGKCRKNGIQLFHIFIDELIYKKNLIVNKILYLTGKINSRKYARNCDIKEISSKEAKDFCENNHLQGYQSSSIKLGAFYNGELVSVMTFRKYIFDKENFSYEISRFCSDGVIVGIAGKFIKYFFEHYDFSYIISYADKRYSLGKVYEKLGFVHLKDTPPNYWYINRHTLQRIHRFSFRKDKIKEKFDFFDENLSEWENMKMNGYDRMWDCGNLVYKLEK